MKLFFYCFLGLLYTTALGQNETQGWLNYNRSDKSFGLSYPSNWKLEENVKDAKLYLTVRNDPKSSLPDAEIVLFIYPIPQGQPTTVGALKALTLKDILSYSNGKIIDYDDKSLYNYPGAIFDYTYANSRKSNPTHLIAWVILRDNNYYTLRYVSTSKMDTFHLDAGKKILNSFTFPNLITSSKNTVSPSKPVVVNGGTEDRTTNQNFLIEGTNLLFKNTKTKLTLEEKKEIYKLLKFRIAKDKQSFVDASDNTDEYSFPAEAWTVDLNGDGTEEVIVDWGNATTSGNAGSTVTMFIKNGSNYQENFGFGGSVSEIIPSFHYGFPDLSFAGPGMKIPVWRYNGSQYQHYQSLSDAEYKKLKTVSFEAFQKNPKLVLGNKNQQTNPSVLPNDDIVIPPTKSNPNAKTLILKRWVTVNVIGSNHESFIADKERGIVKEFQFTSGGKGFAYEKGILKGVVSYVMAPDGKSMLMSMEGEKGQVSIEILSITSKEMILRFPMYYDNDKVIMRPK